MATTVLGAAGDVLGRGAGRVIGSWVGRQIDLELSSSPRRLSDLRTPSSQYGDPIPAIRGHMRVAGVVLWASQPVATSTISKGGTTNGSSVSFAYGLSSGILERFSRIWADGRLIRDEVGQQEVEFEARLHNGSEDQASDPFVESLLGQETATAFRGIAYLLFENFDLTSFGNRIPLITVEVYGQDEQLSAEECVCAGLGVARPPQQYRHSLEGYAASGDDQLSAVSALCRAFSPAFAYRDGRWTMANDPILHTIDRDLWSGLCTRERMSGEVGITEQPTRVSVRFFDPALDFAAGEKSARLPGREVLRRIELPAALTGEDARVAASEELSRLQTTSAMMWLPLPLTYADIELGDHVCAEDSPTAAMVVCGKILRAGKFDLQLRQQRTAFTSSITTTSSRIRSKALVRTPVKVALVELPGALLDSAPSVAALVTGGHEPFQSLPLTISHIGHSDTLASASRSAPEGVLVEKLGWAPPEIFDLKNKLLVRFDEDPILTSSDEATLLAGANLISVGGEFIQYCTAIPLGDSAYEFTGLLRGRFDSSRSGEHGVGTPLYLLEDTRMAKIPLDRNVIGSAVDIQVFGPDGSEGTASTRVSGLAARPWSPCHLRSSEKIDGVEVSWIRRSKEGLPWLDYVDVSSGVPGERYLVSVSGQSTERLDIQAEARNAFIPFVELNRIGPRPWLVTVRQLGDFAASNASVLTIN